MTDTIIAPAAHAPAAQPASVARTERTRQTARTDQTAPTAETTAHAHGRVFDPAHPLPFETGLPFPRREASSPKDYLDAALAAARYIARFQREDADGVYWQGAGLEPGNHTLYNGQAGIAYFLIELARATGDAATERIARSATRRLALHWREAIDHVPYPFIGNLQYGYHLGVAGVATVLAIAYERYADPTVGQSLRRIVDWFASEARRDADGGAYWADSSTLILDSGVTLALLRVRGALAGAQGRAADDGESVDGDSPLGDLDELIRAAGRHLLATGEPGPRGGLVFNGTKAFRDYSTPNFELGTSGAAYTLIRLHRFTGDRAYLHAAEEAVRYLDTVSVQIGADGKAGATGIAVGSAETGAESADGFLIPVRIGPDGTPFKGNGDLLADAGDDDPDHGELAGDYTEPIFYLGACHGPAGTGRLYYELARITGRDEYLERLGRNIDGFEALGAPERTSAGLWSVYYCCGHASLLQFFIGLDRAYPGRRWHDLAERTASVLLGVEEPLGGNDGNGGNDDGAADWPVSFFRLHPSKVTRGLGYYDGVAGIATALLQQYGALTGTFAVDRLADDPLPAD